MTKRRREGARRTRLLNRNIFIVIVGPEAQLTSQDDKGESGGEKRAVAKGKSNW
jgi:hypothetical protein